MFISGWQLKAATQYTESFCFFAFIFINHHSKKNKISHMNMKLNDYILYYTKTNELGIINNSKVCRTKKRKQNDKKLVKSASKEREREGSGHYNSISYQPHADVSSTTSVDIIHFEDMWNIIVDSGLNFF